MKRLKWLILVALLMLTSGCAYYSSPYGYYGYRPYSGYPYARPYYGWGGYGYRPYGGFGYGYGYGGPRYGWGWGGGHRWGGGWHGRRW